MTHYVLYQSRLGKPDVHSPDRPFIYTLEKRKKDEVIASGKTLVELVEEVSATNQKFNVFFDRITSLSAPIIGLNYSENVPVDADVIMEFISLLKRN